MKHPRLRIAFSVACGVSTALLIALWARTFTACDTVFCPLVGGNIVVATSRQSGLGIRVGPSAVQTWGWNALPPETVPQIPYSTLLGVSVYASWAQGLCLRARYVVLIIGSTFLSLVPWIGWSTQFSTRTLLFATTVFGVALGLIVWLAR